MTILVRILMGLITLSLGMLGIYLPWYMSTDEVETPCMSHHSGDGRWVYQPLQVTPLTAAKLEEVIGYHTRHYFTHKCYMHRSQFTRSVALLNYRWEPTSCQLIGIDPAVFSQHLAEHPMLLVGDSIAEIHFHSINSILGEHIVDRPTPSNLSHDHPNMWHHERVHFQKYSEPNAVSLAYIRSDYLVRISDFALIQPHDVEGPSIGRDQLFPWQVVTCTTQADELICRIQAVPQFDYVVLNSALHWVYSKQWGPHQSREELMDAYTKGMNTVFDFLKENVKPHQIVWYRSTPYGHKSCSQYTEPLTTPVLPPPDMYNWDMLSSFDKVWQDWIDAQQDPRFRFLNVSHLTNLRGDVHSNPDRDCMHTCIPGPVDEWSKLLFHEITLSSGSPRRSFFSFFKIPIQLP